MGARRTLVAAVSFALAGLAAPGAARAGGTVTITLTQDGQNLATNLGISAADLQKQAQDALATAYEVNRVDDFLQAFGDATSFSNRGIGADYASNGDGLMFGVAANLAVATDNFGEELHSDHPVAGVAPNLTIMGGVNLARWNHPKWTFYANLFTRSGSLDQLDGSITSLGLHAQRTFFSPTRGLKSLVLQWGGIDVTAGVELSRWSFSASHPLTTSFQVSGSSATSDVSLSATGRFDLESEALVVPVEVTTSFRLFYFASVYGGAGLDLQMGKTTIDASLDGSMTATDPTNGGAKVDMGTANVSVNGSRGPSPGKVRGLLGVQANVWKLKVFVQGNLMPFSEASVALGLRFVL